MTIQEVGTERAGMLAGGAVVLFSGLLGTHGPELFLWILGAMGVDLFSGLLRALIRAELDWQIFLKGVMKKILMLTAVYPAAMGDRIINMSGVVSSESGPVVFSVMVALCMYEGASITKNLRQVFGKTAFVIALLRSFDAMKYAAKHGSRVPRDRSYDPGNEDDHDA